MQFRVSEWQKRNERDANSWAHMHSRVKEEMRNRCNDAGGQKIERTRCSVSGVSQLSASPITLPRFTLSVHQAATVPHVEESTLRSVPF